jgi:hypothetical protein
VPSRQVASGTTQPAADIEYAQRWVKVELIEQLHSGLSATDVKLIDRRQLVRIEVLEVRTQRHECIENFASQLCL